MKEILAIIRPSMIGKTKKVLDALGYPSLTAISAVGRGKQKSFIDEVVIVKNNDELRHYDDQMRYVPKRMISLVIPAEDVDLVVEAIMKVNSTGAYGDGKIFVCPIDNSIRVRNKDEGVEAIL
ncbi:P-II family nitrogen regulator [Methanobrevibacter sp. TMH8]|uniref:P-II family nitrogen regulator n=1 Tax=Methanobrevibacter sp. TMH8 TaxID=2848611 RepID=UPI001CD004CB|nr:P-II family nitrogen regulator [Methanobrevibacter sp. TMH8]MBZ9570706.1 P-II family nitrogen regulator [Methanobrevibacter sp. TMH8]